MSTQENKKMTYVRLGNSGLKVSRLILGLMSYGSKEWANWVVEEEEAIQHIKVAYEEGIQTFDTANMYSNGESERIFGKAIKQLNLPRDEIVVMTKLYAVVGRNPGDSNYIGDSLKAEANGYVNQYGLSRKHVFEAIKHSLERLQLDYVDVFQFHAMQNYAINNKLTPFIPMQNHYNLLYREEEREMIPTLKMFGVGMILWSPLARGTLFAKAMDTTKESNNEIISRVEKIAKSRGISMAQVGLAWHLSKDYTSAPVIGITKLKNFEDTIGAIHVKLTEEEIKLLEEPYGPRGIVGHF
ncbi:hypothetical protein RSAG8_10056, partial [Rhizoctonia solani AG-8 WAC10335]